VADLTVPTVYFGQAGPEKTERTLQLAHARAKELHITNVVVASTSGKTGALACEMMGDIDVVVVTHSTGFKAPNVQELQPQYKERIKRAGGTILTCQHALGGVGRAVRRKLGTYQVDEIMAFTLRTLCQGLKVACEITVMAADAGVIPASQEVVAVGGTGQGADAAAVLLSANAHDFFDQRVLEVICKPRCWR